MRLSYGQGCPMDSLFVVGDPRSSLVPLVELKENKIERSGEERGKGHKYVCITRPRRFGKTVMANMISSYFGKGIDSGETFKGLKASSSDWFENHLNQHNVIHIMCNELPDECTTYAQYIARIKRRLLNDLIREFPDTKIDGNPGFGKSTGICSYFHEADHKR